MAETETTEQVGVDSDTAQKAADILSLIADYEEEVDTVVGETQEEAITSLGASKHVQSQHAASVQQKPAVIPLEAQVAAAQNQSPKPTLPTTDEHSQDLDGQVEALQQQLSRAKQLHSQTTTVASIETTPVDSDQQQVANLANMLNETRAELHTASAQRNLFADQLASSVSRIDKLETTKANFQTQTSGQGNFEKLQTELSATGNILTEVLTAQIELAREVEAIKTKIAYTNQPRSGSPFVGQQQNRFVGLSVQTPPQYQPVSTERDMLIEELFLIKARLRKLEYTKTSVNSQQSGISAGLQGQLDETARNNEILNAQVQELVGLLEGSNIDRNVLEADLALANKTINDLQTRAQTQEDRIADYVKQIIELHAQLVDQAAKQTNTHVKQVAELRAQLVKQTARLTKTHHELQLEIAHRRKIEQILKRISKQFQYTLKQKTL